MRSFIILVAIYFKFIVMEAFNFVTDLVVPFLGVAGLVLAVLPVPLKFVRMVKIAEAFMVKLGATKQDVENKFNRRY